MNYINWKVIKEAKGAKPPADIILELEDEKYSKTCFNVFKRQYAK